MKELTKTKTDQGRRQNHPQQPKQLMCIWGEKKRTEGRTQERNREQTPNPATWTIYLYPLKNQKIR